METTRRWKAIVVIALLLTSSCRFKLPNTNEGQVLARRGAFPGGLPAWVKPPEEMGAASAQREGLVPKSYGAANVVQAANSRSASQAVRSEQDEQEARRRQADLERSRTQTEAPEEAASPLDRIEKVCPGIEPEVTAALATVEIEERINKYDTLTVRCPTSADLWFWLGRDYQTAGRYGEAVRAFEQVLVLDPENQAAQALLDEARQGSGPKQTDGSLEQ